MGTLVEFRPRLRFPFRKPFQILDQHNGKARGTWFYRSPHTDSIWGPFHDEAEAETMMWLEGPSDQPPIPA